MRAPQNPTSLDAAPAYHAQAPLGLLYGMLAYSCWGLIPIFFKTLAHLPPAFVLGQRIVWSFLFFFLLVALPGNLGQVVPAMRARQTVRTLIASAVLIAINWGVFIYAVSNGRVLDASLGYFVAPLVVVALGVIVLGERLRRWQVAALALAGAGVTVMAIAHGGLPWIGLAVALTFGGYGLFRKTVAVPPVTGLCIETALLLPVGFLLIGLTPILSGSQSAVPTAGGSRGGFFQNRPGSDIGLLLLSGPVTGIPLLLFTAAARRLRLSTIGLLQYIGPIGQFVLAVFIYREPFGPTKLAGFALIWLALVLYSIDSIRAYRMAMRPDSVGTEEPV